MFSLGLIVGDFDREGRFDHVLSSLNEMTEKEQSQVLQDDTPQARLQKRVALYEELREVDPGAKISWCPKLGCPGAFMVSTLTGKYYDCELCKQSYCLRC